MKSLFVGFAALLLAAPAADGGAGSVGQGTGIILPSADSNPCHEDAQLCLNFDGSAENGYCWNYGGITPPYYGAFAECCDLGHSCVCGIELLLTGVGYPCGPFDAYVWADASGRPGAVLSMTPGLNPCPVAIWPQVSTHDLPILETEVQGMTWIGYWYDTSHSACGYFIAADTNGFGGCPVTNITPGIGYPTGWQDVSLVWGPTPSIGIGCWVRPECVFSPTKTTTWGAIKGLYR
jgi:hypothetical protein